MISALGPRVELLDPHDRDRRAAARRAASISSCPILPVQSSTRRTAPRSRSGSAGRRASRWNAPSVSSSTGERVCRHAQVPLRREADQRLARRRVDLAPQHVEVLRRGRRVDDPQVVLGAQREEALDARAGVLGALALEAVGEQQREAATLAPLVLGGDDELVDDDLRAVDEVAELRLPADPRVGSATE